MAGGYKYFEAIEKNAGLLGILVAIMVSIGGLAEITPLFMRAHEVKPPADLKPYDPLRLAGKDIYVREGCYPVSYTHLDVYKRQPASFKACIAPMAIRSLAANTASNGSSRAISILAAS